MGDGIEHVQVDAAGNIWVGYFDEGIFGAGDSAGIVCYDGRGVKLWEYDPPAGFDHPYDCYALKVSRDATWACYYTDFPIVRIGTNYQVRAWTTGLRGPRQLAVSDDSVLVYGSYETESETRLLRLTDRQAEDVAHVTLRWPDSTSIDNALVVGRNDRVHVFAGNDWYIFTSGHLPAR